MLQVRVRRRLGTFELDVGFDVEANEILAVHGPSGSGKTTLINLLAGLERPDSGRIAIDDRVLFDSAAGVDIRPEARRIGYVFQDCRLFPHLSVAANLRYGRHRHGSRVDFDQVVALLGLEGLLGRRPRSLSGGEKQRVAIGRALLSGPQILLLDEPLASIDQRRKDEILPFIRRLRDEFGMPIVYVTHAPEEIVRIADRTIRIENGRLCENAPVARFGIPALAETGTRVIAMVRGDDPETGMTVLASSLGRLLVPRRPEPPGTLVRVAIAAWQIDAIASGEDDTVAILPISRTTALRP